jgi:hypothetical protein
MIHLPVALDTSGRYCKKTGVHRSERYEIWYRRKQLKIQNLRLNAINLRAQVIPTKLNVVVPDQFVGVCR